MNKVTTKNKMDSVQSGIKIKETFQQKMYRITFYLVITAVVMSGIIGTSFYLGVQYQAANAKSADTVSVIHVASSTPQATVAPKQ